MHIKSNRDYNPCPPESIDEEAAAKAREELEIVHGDALNQRKNACREIENQNYHINERQKLHRY